MVIVAVIAVAVCLALVGVGVLAGMYNGLVQVRNNVEKAWNNIDVILMQRNDELRKLVEACKGYVKHESDLLERLTEMRTGYAAAQEMQEKAEIENRIQLSMTHLNRVWENYPQLRATENFQQLQQRISGLESTIADRREFFNDSVNIYNIRIESFPHVLLARALGYLRRPFLTVPEEKKEDVELGF